MDDRIPYPIQIDLVIYTEAIVGKASPKRVFEKSLHKYQNTRWRWRSLCLSSKPPGTGIPLNSRKKGDFDSDSGSPFIRGLGGSGIQHHNLQLFKHPLKRIGSVISIRFEKRLRMSFADSFADSITEWRLGLAQQAIG